MDKQLIGKMISWIKEGKYHDAKELIEQAHKSDIYEKYTEWFFTWSSEETNLYNKACDFEELYFTDLTMKEYEAELAIVIDEETETEFREDLTEDGEGTIQYNWMIKIGELEDNVGGYCDETERVICIDKDRTDNDLALLHEMIHAYIGMLASHYHQFLTLKLYLKLQSQIPRLVELLTLDIHNRIGCRDSGHGPLFVLKSLDLDLRLDKPLGTVYSYGRQEIYKDFYLHGDNL